MRLTTKGRFAVTAMLDLAMSENSKPVTLAGISERQAISLSYLEQLFSRLRKQGLVKSVRGPGGEAAGAGARRVARFPMGGSELRRAARDAARRPPPLLTF